MTPKEKAIDIVEKMMQYSYEKIDDEISPRFIVNYKISREDAKQCALIMVGEILDKENNLLDFDSDRNYWLEVKKEIKSL